MLASASVTTTEVIEVLVWWAVVLAAPLILIRRRRRRGSAPRPPRFWRRASGKSEGQRQAEQTLSAQPAPSTASDTVVEHAPPDAREKLSESLGDPSPGLNTAATAIGDVAGSRPVLRARLSPETLEPLCRYVDFRRRLELAASELEARLVRLPADRWRIEPYPLTGERRNTLLVIGETGVFVISATYSPGHWDDVIAVNRLARKIQLLLPGYGGQVRAALCHPFTAIRPRIWHRPDERGEWIGAWLIGGDSVIEWLEHFAAGHGLAVGDLERFDELTKPNWLRGAIPTPPSWPPIHEPASPDSQD